MINRFITALLPLLLLNGCGGGSSDQSKPNGNQSDTVGNTAELSLIEAAEAGELEVVEKLLGSGVDVNEQSDDQSTALHLAASLQASLWTSLALDGRVPLQLVAHQPRKRRH